MTHNESALNSNNNNNSSRLNSEGVVLNSTTPTSHTPPLLLQPRSSVLSVNTTLSQNTSQRLSRPCTPPINSISSHKSSSPARSHALSISNINSGSILNSRSRSSHIHMNVVNNNSISTPPSLHSAGSHQHTNNNNNSLSPSSATNSIISKMFLTPTESSSTKNQQTNNKPVTTRPTFMHKQTILKTDRQFVLRSPEQHIQGGDLYNVPLSSLTPAAIAACAVLKSPTTQLRGGGSTASIHATSSNIHACPFCRRYLLSRSTVLAQGSVVNTNTANDNTTGNSTIYQHELHHSDQSVAITTHNVKKQENSNTVNRSVSILNSVFLQNNNNYNKTELRPIVKILVEGWLLKKGSGRDVLGATNYKPRWARLVLTPHQDVHVPMLYIYWFEGSLTPSSILDLQNKVAKPVDSQVEEEDWMNVHCFDIIDSSSETEGARRFASSADERNEWVYAINLSLNNYHREKNINNNIPSEAAESKQEKVVDNNNNHVLTSRWKEGEFTGGSK